VSSHAQGVQIFIGESTLVPIEEMSVVTAPYEVNGKIVGTLGVIGPTRMAYNRVIPIVDITARLLSLALSQHKPAACAPSSFVSSSRGAVCAASRPNGQPPRSRRAAIIESRSTACREHDSAHAL
jgi:hypothetical protein